MCSCVANHKRGLGLGSALAVVVALAAVIGAAQSKDAFRASYGALLCLLGGAQFYVAVVLYRNRQNLLIELFQPVGLSLMAIAGAVATISCFTFAFPESDVGCALRQPIILTCLSFIGSIIVARSWRIGCIISPTLDFASSSIPHHPDKMSDRLSTARKRLMGALSAISDWTGVVASCGKMKRAAVSTRIRRRITFGDALQVTAVLMLPQIILQVISLSVPSVRMQSVEIEENLHVCESSTDPWMLVLGIAIAALPFFLALLQNIDSEGMLGQFREFDGIASSMQASLCALLVTLPTAGMIGRETSEAWAYLMSASLMSFVLPLCFNTAWTKALVVKKRPTKSKLAATNDNDRASVARTVSFRTASSSNEGDGKDDVNTLKAVEDAERVGQLFEGIGRIEKALEVDRDILSMFKAEEEYSWEHGFNDAEINSLGPKSLQVVIETMIRSAQRWWESFMTSPEARLLKEGPVVEKPLQYSLSCCLEAFSVFEMAPARHKVKDRRFLFAGYSFFTEPLRCGFSATPEGQRPDEFEDQLASNFVNETTFQQLHYCRSLCMKAELKAKHGKFEEAIAVVDEMRRTYNPQLHSKALQDEYKQEYCGNTFATCVLWLYSLGRTEDALNACDYVIDMILPQIDRYEIRSVCKAILPLIPFLKEQGREGALKALQLYETRIAMPLNELGPKRFPLAFTGKRAAGILLRHYAHPCDKYDGMESDVSWFLDGEEKFSYWQDALFQNVFCWSYNAVYAELALVLTKAVGNCEEQEAATQQRIVQLGLRYAEAAEDKLKDSEIVFPQVVHSSLNSVRGKLLLLDSRKEEAVMGPVETAAHSSV